MTFRDTSAFTTLDNANMGIREDFEKLADSLGLPKTCLERQYARAGWNARQPEIDALTREINALQSVNDTLIEQLKYKMDEVARLTADAERCNYLISNFIRCEPDMSGNHHWIARGRLIERGQTARDAIDTAMKDFSTTTKE